MSKFSGIVLAAGVGKRMKSEKSKVLHAISGKPIIQKTVETLEKIIPGEIVVVANQNNAEELKNVIPSVKIALQSEQLGTADATKVGLGQIHDQKDVAVLYGDDTAFYQSATIEKVFNHHKDKGAKITFVTILKDNPQGLGRIIRDGQKLLAIVEEKDASDEQKKINEVNDGLYFFDQNWLKNSLEKISPSSATGELYITDLIELALKEGEKVETYTLEDQEEWHGINTQIELAKANFKEEKNIHIMGISGAGAAAVAGIAQAVGFKVTGCDLNPNSPYIDTNKTDVYKGHSAEHIKNISCLVLSPAILKFDPENEEVKEAKHLGIPTLTWEEFLGEILQEGKFTVAVAGAYGKSTTTAMIGKILVDSNLDPTVEVGAKVLDWGTNFRVGQSKYFVLEADEYNDNFLSYSPDIAVVLNISWEHPDFFQTELDLENSYINFINNIKSGGLLLTTEEILKKFKDKIRADIKVQQIEEFPKLELKIIGDFRQDNVNAAQAVAKALDLEINQSSQSLKTFSGLGRRLEEKGKIGQVMFYDDYAVQPYTIKTTANALKEKYKSSKILLVIEPHTFTRVNKFFDNFVEAIKSINVDRIFITDVFAAREKGNVSELSEKLASKVGQGAKHTGSVEETAHEIIEGINSFDVVLTMGAGNVYKIYDLVKNGQH